MNPLLLNVLFGVSLFAVTVLLLWQTFQRGRAEDDLFYMGQRLEKSIVTCDRLYREKVEAVAIADHAIEVITEARMIVKSERISFLVRTFVDKRQEAQNKIDDKINAENLIKLINGEP